jgi:tripartite-type tricarboxylate transporter receptor subunit TctC
MPKPWQPLNVLMAAEEALRLGRQWHRAAPGLFKMMTDTVMGHVPYRAAQPAYQDVISGRVPVFFDNMSTAMSLAKAGKVRALAITSKKRSALMPELPTVDGVPILNLQLHSAAKRRKNH